MNEFYLWFTTGITHICDFRAYDHILFLMAICAVYHFAEWKEILIALSAFTIGHSITLAASTFQWISIPSALIEFLIPCTIVFTCIRNIYTLKSDKSKHSTITYVSILLFGCIHGLGFSSLLRSMLGKEESVIGPLFSFNIGLEIGQFVLVLVLFLLTYIVQKIIRQTKYEEQFFISSAVFGISFIMLIERFTNYLHTLYI